MTPRQFLKARVSLGLTQAQLADRMGVDQSTLSRWESGQRKVSKMAQKVLSGLMVGQSTP